MAKKTKTKEPRATCGNCQHECPVSKLGEIRHYGERVEAAGPEPDGECPKCGALSYLVVKPQPATTPRPWRAEKDTQNSIAILPHDGDRPIVSTYHDGDCLGPMDWVNVSLIVKAVNAHDALIALARDVLTASPHAGRWDVEALAALRLAGEEV